MTKTNIVTQSRIDQEIVNRCLPEDSRDTVREILSSYEPEVARDELDIFAAQCYRFEPNHPRYDVNRAWYPRVEEGEYEGIRSIGCAA